MGKKRPGSVPRRGAHLTTPKGGKRGGGKPGNRNTIHGPRVGRHEKFATSKVAGQPLPSPKPTARLPQRRRHTKTGGKDFGPGQNSHDGTVFRRTEDMLPRGNIALFAKIVYHDGRKKLYDRNMAILDKGTNREVIALQDWLANRIDGLPTKRVDVTTRREPTFLLTLPDGSVVPALPERVGGGATPAAASAEDAMILGLQPVRL